MKKIKVPKMEDYERIKAELSKEDWKNKSDLEDATIAMALLEANGVLTEEELEDAANAFSVDVGIWEAIRAGYLKVSGVESGEIEYSLTDRGRSKVENILRST